MEISSAGVTGSRNLLSIQNKTYIKYIKSYSGILLLFLVHIPPHEFKTSEQLLSSETTGVHTFYLNLLLHSLSHIFTCAVIYGPSLKQQPVQSAVTGTLHLLCVFPRSKI